MIGVDEAAVSVSLWNAVTKTSPRFWEEDANTAGYPVNLPCRGCSGAGKDHFRHFMGIPLGVSERQS